MSSIFKKLAKRQKKLGLEDEEREETYNIKNKVQRVDAQDSDGDTSEEDADLNQKENVINGSSSSSAEDE